MTDTLFAPGSDEFGEHTSPQLNGGCCMLLLLPLQMLLR
jgi:hypothetical protein